MSSFYNLAVFLALGAGFVGNACADPNEASPSSEGTPPTLPSARTPETADQPSVFQRVWSRTGWSALTALSFAATAAYIETFRTQSGQQALSQRMQLAPYLQLGLMAIAAFETNKTLDKNGLGLGSLWGWMTSSDLDGSRDFAQGIRDGQSS